MDSENVDQSIVSLPGAGETERTVFENLNIPLNTENIEENIETIDNTNTDQVPTQNIEKTNEIINDNIIKLNESNGDITENSELPIHCDKEIDEEIVAIENNSNFDETINHTYDSNTSLNNQQSENEILEKLESNKENLLKNVNNIKEIVETEEIIIEEIEIRCTPLQQGDCEYVKPPVPIQTYCWEELKRAKAKGGYPWTHLYKLPLGPDDEPEIVLRLRTTPRNNKKRTQQLLLDDKRISIENFDNIEKKLCIVLDAENPLGIDPIDRIDDLNFTEEIQIAEEDTLHEPPIKPTSPKGILKKSKSLDTENINPSERQSNHSPSLRCCHPFVDKIKTMADKHFHKPHTKKVHLSEDIEVPLTEEQKILRLKQSPKTTGREITSYVEREDSDDLLNSANLEDSPCITKKHIEKNMTVVPDEVIHLPLKDENQSQQIENNNQSESNVTVTIESTRSIDSDSKEEKNIIVPSTPPRKKKTHVYEDIENLPGIENIMISENLKNSLKSQDDKIISDIQGKHDEYLDENLEPVVEEIKKNSNLLAPISSMDSTSSDEDRKHILPALSEEESGDERIKEVSHIESIDLPSQNELDEEVAQIFEKPHNQSPGSDKKVRFSPSTEDVSGENEEENVDLTENDVREDVILPNLTENKVKIDNRWSNMSDHEYEPVGEPVITEVIHQTNQTQNQNGIDETSETNKRHLDEVGPASRERKLLRQGSTEDDGDEELTAQELQAQIEDRFFNPQPQPSTNTGTKPKVLKVEPKKMVKAEKEEDIKPSLMTSFQNKRRDMQSKIKTQASKVSTKVRNIRKPKKTDSPVKVKERKKFKAPEFSKIKNIHLPTLKKPDIKKPEFKNLKSKFKKPDIKKPEFKVLKSNIQKLKSHEFKIPEFRKASAPKIEISQPMSSMNVKPVQEPIPPIVIKLNPDPEELEAELREIEAKRIDDFGNTNEEQQVQQSSPTTVTNHEQILHDQNQETIQEQMISSVQPDEKTPSSIDEPKKSKFRRPEIPKFKMAEKFASLRSRSTEVFSSKPKTSEIDIENGTNTAPPPQSDGQKRFKFTKPDIHMPQMPDFHMPKWNISEKIDSFRRSRSTEVPRKEDDPDVEEAEPVPTKRRFNRPDFKKFKIPEKLSSIKLYRSKSMKEPTSETYTATTVSEMGDESESKPKKKFEFDFATYPRFLSKLKKQKKMEEEEDIPRINIALASAPHKEVDKNNKYLADTYRESSLEKRMRMVEEQQAYDDQEELDYKSEEQKQMNDYDKENREIHELTAKQEFKRQPIERQESDLNSEDMKILEWVKQETAKNKLLGTHDSDLASDEIDYKYGHMDDHFDHNNKETRGSTPHTNQETISSGGSSGIQRAKGVLEEIDDDEFFLRKKGISQENFPINEYISSALRENDMNALDQVGKYDAYYPNINTPSDKFNRSLESDDIPNLPHDDSYFGTFPPNKPKRRNKKSYQTQRYDDEDQCVPDDEHIHSGPRFFTEDNDMDTRFYENEHMEGIEQPEIFITSDISYTNQYHSLPPTAPKRRKKDKVIPRYYEQDEEEQHGILEDEIEKVAMFDKCEKVILPPKRWPSGPSQFDNEEIAVHTIEHEYFQDHPDNEDFQSSPVPKPRRSRSHNRVSETERSPSNRDDSISSDILAKIEETIIVSNDSQDGYAVIKKDVPPRPPAPVRHKRSTQSLNSGERQFFTMPLLRRESSPPPTRPIRTYSTIVPNKPPRQKSETSLNDTQRSRSSPDVTQYEEIDDEPEDSQNKLQSGDVINKMKYRPLPPPPRPPREKKSKKSDKFHHDNDDGFDDNTGAERITVIDENIKFDEDYLKEDIPEQFDIVNASELKSDDEEEYEEEGADRIVPENQIEVEHDDESSSPKTSSETQTLQEILKNEQEAELERARQLAQAKSLEKGIQKFRESSQRTYSEKSKGSTGDMARGTGSRGGSRNESYHGSRTGSRQGSRPITPSAVVIEKRTSTPTVLDNTNQTITEALLMVRPLDIDDEIEDNELIEEILKRHNESLSGPVPEFLSEPEKLDETKEINLDTESEKDYIDKSKDVEINNIVDNRIIEEISGPPPVVPPRRKSMFDSNNTENQITSTVEVKKEESSKPLSIQTQTSISIESSPVDHVDSSQRQTGPVDRLEVSELAVDRLSVNALHANQIFVSDLQGIAINTQEIECKSGNLVVKNLDLPPGFIEEIVERIRCQDKLNEISQTEMAPPVPPPPPTDEDTQKEREISSTHVKENEEVKKTSTEEKIETPPPARPPPPQSHPEFFSEFFPYSIPPASFYNLRNPSEEDSSMLPQQPHHRRRRQPRHYETTSDEENQKEQRNRNSRTRTKSPEPSIGELGVQLFSACNQAVQRSFRQVLIQLRDQAKDENREFHVAIIALVVVVIFLFLLGMGSSSSAVHHHHWDYFNPPGGGSEQKQ